MPKDGQATRTHVGNVIDQTSRIFKEGESMLSRGSAIKFVDKYKQETGAEYCRVWTKDRSYMNYSDTMKRTANIRKFDDSILGGDSRPWNINIAPMSSGNYDAKNSFRNSFGAKNSTNIFESPTGDGFYAKKYMFSIENLAWQFINKLGDKEYYSIHIRRNDFQYKELFIPCEQILENIKGVIPQGSKLYIATDHRDREFFKPLSEYYQTFFYEDVKKEVAIFTEFDNNWIPIIEQFICTRGIKFIGNSHSTLSSYIYRMRGYMSDIEDKNYYLNTETFDQHKQIPFTADTQFKGNWFREYNDSWSFGNGSIFVSIASYCDSQIIDTLKSLYSEAIDPSRVHVGVNLQDTEEAYEKLKQLNFPMFKFLKCCNLGRIIK